MSSSSSTTDSKRWTAFHSALQVAIQQAAHKWSYEDFAQCFSVWCSEDPEGAQAVFNAVSRHMESQVTASCETLFSEQHAREGVNILHAVVTEARVRKKQGETDRLDIWRESLDPRSAVRARGVRVMEAEVERLKATLSKMEQENLAISRQIKEDDAKAQEAEEKANELLDLFDDVYEKWSKLPQDDISLWTLQAAEALDATETP